MKLLGIVIFYKFDLVKLKESILTYIDTLDKLIIWRNSEISEYDILSVFSDDYRQKIEVLGNGENIFIAGALNRAVEYARTNGYTHILTMDQDSKFGQEDAEKYRKTIEGGDNYNNVIFSYVGYVRNIKDIPFGMSFMLYIEPSGTRRVGSE